MNKNKQTSLNINKYSSIYYRYLQYRHLFLFLTVGILIPFQEAKTEELHLKCTGNFEINRGELIKPDWELSYITEFNNLFITHDFLECLAKKLIT